MKKKLLFVINRISVRNTKKQEQISKLINNFCIRNSLQFEIYNTSGKNDQDHIKKIIAGFNPEILVAVGGDGTINMVSGLILNSAISLGIIPMGSANGLAKNLGIPLV